MADKDVAERVQKLTLIEQNLSNLLGQKQQFQNQLFEVGNALSELDKSPKAYKIVGSIMVQTDKADLKTELSSKKEVLELRMKNIEKQEEQLQQKAKSIQDEVFNK